MFNSKLPFMWKSDYALICVSDYALAWVCIDITWICNCLTNNEGKWMQTTINLPTGDCWCCQSSSSLQLSSNHNHIYDVDIICDILLIYVCIHCTYNKIEAKISFKKILILIFLHIASKFSFSISSILNKQKKKKRKLTMVHKI